MLQEHIPESCHIFFSANVKNRWGRIPALTLENRAPRVRSGPNFSENLALFGIYYIHIVDLNRVKKQELLKTLTSLLRLLAFFCDTKRHLQLDIL